MIGRLARRIGGAWVLFRSLPRSRQILVVAGLALLILFANAESEPSPGPTAAREAPPRELTLAERLGIEIERGVTPDLVGLSAVDVVKVVEELKERPRSLQGWPRGVGPADEGFDVAGLDFFVCSQSVAPGARYSSSMRLQFRSSCEGWRVVPDFTGLDEAEADREARQRGITLAGTSSRLSDSFFVCEQDTEPGTVFTGSGYERVRLTVRVDCVAYAAEIAERAARDAEREAEQRARDERRAILADPNTEEGRRVFINETSQALGAMSSGAARTRQQIRAGEFLTSFRELFGRTGYGDFVSGYGALREQGPDDVQEQWQRHYDEIVAARKELDAAVSSWIEKVLSDRELDAYFAEMERLGRRAQNFIESLR